MAQLITLVLSTSIFRLSFAYNFPYESIQLTPSDVANNPDIAFGTLPAGPIPKCKTSPGDSNWPSSERWNALNSSLEGALVKGIPPAAACYKGEYENSARCEEARQGSRSSNYV